VEPIEAFRHRVEDRCDEQQESSHVTLRSSDMSQSFTSAQALAFVREAGEDRLSVLRHEDALVVVVADGVGGISGGAAAAELLLKLVEEAILVPGFDPDRSEAWAELLARADLALEVDPRAGETTGVVIAISEQGLVGASSGDSGAWMVNGEDGGIDDLTSCRGFTD
jgi:PPM family protein phosphatase